MADNNENKDQGTIQGKYERLTPTREPYLRRARDCALVTIPSLMPEETTTSGTHTYPTPWQSVGSRGLNNLAAKLLLALFPPNQPFFKLTVERQILEEMGESKGSAEEALSIIEQEVGKDFNSSPTLRVKALETIKQLLNSGSVLVYQPKKSDNIKVYRLDNFVIERDGLGNVQTIIAREQTSYSTMSKELKEKLDEYNGELEGTESKENEPLFLYTHVNLEDGKYIVKQECSGVDVTQGTISYNEDNLPWLALRLNPEDGEDYGRSLIEQYYGDLLSLEGLTKAIVEGSMAAAKTLLMVRPNATTKKDSIVNAKNLDVISGNPEDVAAFRLDKTGDFRVALEASNGIIERLSFAFLLNSAVQRQGERVTAEEIRYVANELEDSLGGVYSSTAQDFQLPLVKMRMAKLQAEGKIPTLPKGLVKPTIITGMEALGRTADLQRLDMFINSLAVLGEEAVAKYVNIPEFISRRAAALSIDTKDLVKTQEQIQQEAQQAQEQAMQQQLIQGATPNITKGVVDSMNQQQPNQGT